MDTGVHLDLDHVHLTLLLKLESFHFHLNFFMMNFGTEKLRQDMIVEMKLLPRMDHGFLSKYSGEIIVMRVVNYYKTQ